jgi:hypothetical protein
VVFCFPSCQKLLNQERALSAPCSPAGARAGRRNATDRLDPPLGRSPSLFVITDSSDRQALMLFRCLGGSCTGGADRCKAKQSRREEGADVCVLTSNVVRFSDLVQSNNNNLGNHDGALFSSISRKRSNRRCGRTTLNLIINTSRSPAGMTESDLTGATVGVQRCGTSMSAVHQPVLTLVGTAHASSPRKGGRPSEAGLDARQSELAFVVARMWGTSCLSPGCPVTWLPRSLSTRNTSSL